MTAVDFFDLVKKMRIAQQEYFATRRSDSLKTAKRLEKEVDKEINRVNNYITGRDNPSLFK